MINTPIIGTINISSPWSIAYHSMINRFHPRSTAASLHDQQISSMINSLSLDDQHISYMINSLSLDDQHISYMIGVLIMHDVLQNHVTMKVIVITSNHTPLFARRRLASYWAKKWKWVYRYSLHCSWLYEQYHS